jgi:hypothetical protein
MSRHWMKETTDKPTQGQLFYLVCQLFVTETNVNMEADV